MLRITVPDLRNNPAIFVLEGKLTCEWVNELLRVTREIVPRSTCVFDLEAVSYIDRAGEEALCWLNRLGARFATDSLYGKDLCQRLHLRWIGHEAMRKLLASGSADAL
jgi:hypothetical protein